MKLNLGCGQNKIEGFVNVDKYGDPDLRVDLERFPWCPFTEMRGLSGERRFWADEDVIHDNSVDHVIANHVLEHLGATPDVFIGVMKELYRVCADGATIQINVPHPRHDHFIGDPTHVRIITPEVLSLFSKKNCERWAALRAANSPLALYHDVDFEITETRMMLDGKWADMHDKGLINSVKLDQAIRDHNNVVKEIRMVLQVIKPSLILKPGSAMGKTETVSA